MHSPRSFIRWSIENSDHEASVTSAAGWSPEGRARSRDVIGVRKHNTTTLYEIPICNGFDYNKWPEGRARSWAVVPCSAPVVPRAAARAVVPSAPMRSADALAITPVWSGSVGVHPSRTIWASSDATAAAVPKAAAAAVPPSAGSASASATCGDA